MMTDLWLHEACRVTRALGCDGVGLWGLLIVANGRSIASIQARTKIKMTRNSLRSKLDEIGFPSVILC
jgi:hypothetical protein